MKRKLFIIAIVSMITVFSCIDSNGFDSVKVKGTPGIVFKEEVHDFGKIEYNGNGSFDFEFKNNGDQPLILNNVRTSCGCTASKYSKTPIMPDSTGLITVTFNTRLTGSFNKEIKVFSNAGEEPVVLKIKGEVEKDSEEATE